VEPPKQPVTQPVITQLQQPFNAAAVAGAGYPPQGAAAGFADPSAGNAGYGGAYRPAAGQVCASFFHSWGF